MGRGRREKRKMGTEEGEEGRGRRRREKRREEEGGENRKGGEREGQYGSEILLITNYEVMFMHRATSW